MDFKSLVSFMKILKAYIIQEASFFGDVSHN